MLEELAMEKKTSIRSGQGNCTESKKNQDAAVGKQFPRGGRKRETPSSNGSKCDQNRKPLPQKSKAFDKRPKPRGLYYGGGKANPQMRFEELDVEFGSIFSIGSKNQSLNHLLNFHYEPRGEVIQKRQYHSQYGTSTRSLMATQAHKYNKEQFLQANCQFVVREDGDYSFNLGDPDLLVDWDHVELIITGSCDKIVCPICLYPPVAGKITRCGHVYCWSCILHYLALSDKSWRKCPICYESIHKGDLKSVECVEKALYFVGQNITMRLMKREKGSLAATPVDQFNARTSKPILSYGEVDLDTVYSKLLSASHENVLEIISREYNELQSQVEEFKGCPELCFVEQALELLGERRSLLETRERRENVCIYPHSSESNQDEAGQNKTEEITPIEDITPTHPDTDTNDNTSVENITRVSQRSESESAGSEGDEMANISAEDLEIKPSSRAQKHFYFYQAADGQHIYLHSINVRMLEMTYGSLENCPIEITGKIVEKESGSMTPQLRKRLRYLQHVPITCQFEVVELEMRPPAITEETFIHFQSQVEDRQKRRLRQARAEKRREKKIEEAEMRQFNRKPAPNLRIESFFHFPQCGTDEFPRPTTSDIASVASEQLSRSVSPSSSVGKRENSPISGAFAALSLENEDPSSGPSFAQMLREGKTTTQEAWPAIGSGGIGGRSAGNTGAVWPRKRQDSVSHESHDSDNDSAFSPPARPSFNIAEAIQMAASFEKGENIGGRKKKKKKQQKLLFSTGLPKGN
uniref:E3 ubiquitin-protein ligase RNF10 n=1 Tax=Riptortus pedestris TaxID=329032 RepID=R4WJH7_RIPPE|nr:conserved hypothetical protein [Riptortus pedestris]